MSDADLRELERRALQDPGDTAAGWTFARALEKSGDRRGSFRELARIERLGHAEAREALAGSAPAAIGGSQVVRALEVGLPRLKRVVEDYNDAFDASPLIGPMNVMVRGGHVVLDALQLVACALDRPTKVAWAGPRPRVVAPCGPDLLVTTDDGLALLDPRDGAIVASAEGLPGIDSLAVHGDRALVATNQRVALVLDVGSDFGRVVWRRELSNRLWAVAAGSGLGVFSRMGIGQAQLRASSLAREDWVERAVLSRVCLQATDAHGLVLEHGPEEGRELAELNLAGLESRWSLPMSDVSSVVLEGTLAIARARDELVAIERATGTVRWRSRAPNRPFAMALAQGALYLATVTSTLDVDVIDLASGTFTGGFEADLPGVGRYFHHEGETQHVHAFPGGLVAVRNTPGSAIVVVAESA